MEATFSNLTVPVDGSKAAQRGIDYAIALAQGGGALHFCSVVDEWEHDARRACREAVTAAQQGGVAGYATVLYGAVAPAVNRYAKDNGSDAIVIGTSAQRRLSRVVFGSVAESLLAISEVPAVVAHSDDSAPPGGPITVAVDDSGPSRAALMFAVDLARKWNVSLVIETVTPGTDHAAWRAAADLLEEPADLARALNVDFELVTVAGDVPEIIVEDGTRRRSSAIVVGTRPHSAVDRFLHGSVAAAILERARVPVFIIPQTARVALND